MKILLSHEEDGPNECREVRERRKQLKERWKRPEEAGNMSLYALSPRELYDAYAEEASPAELLDRERVDIARDLMLKKGLDPRAAHYVADQMLRYAQEMGEAQQS